MITLLMFAFISGVVTILSPCILPVLPIVLSGSITGGRAKPYGIVTGFVASFTAFTLALTVMVQALGISADVLRAAAVVIIIAFGLVLLVPKLSYWYEMLVSKLASLGRRRNPVSADAGGIRGFGSGLAVGSSLGLVWTPCVGPIMASVTALALTQRVDGGALFITLAYALGTAIPMFAVIKGGRALLEKVPVLLRNTARIQKVFGVLLIVVAISIFFGFDRRFQAAVLDIFPWYGTGLTAIEDNDAVRKAIGERSVSVGDPSADEGGTFVQSALPGNGVLGNYGKAPEIVTTGVWLNADGIRGAPAGGIEKPIRMSDLAGKVVLVDFWTYSCINCIRTIPYLAAWHEAYKDYGLVIIGVHTPEFEFEKNPDNVAKAVKDLGVDWPVVLDNGYAQWNAYSNRYWPAHYFVDAGGNVRYFQFGEGDYRTAEKVIRALITLSGGSLPPGETGTDDGTFASVTPETYLGYARMNSFLSGADFKAGRNAYYSLVEPGKDGQWSLGGEWTIAKEYVSPEAEGVLKLRFNAKKVFLVVEPGGGSGYMRVEVDGKPAADTRDVKMGTVTPGAGRLYEIVDLGIQGSHVLQLEVKGGIRLFTFTFG